MGYSDIPDTYMSRIPAYAFMFFNTRTIIPLQDIMVSPRPFTRFTSITIGLDSRPMSKTIANRAPSVLVPNPCTTDHTASQAASHSREAVELYLYGFHREATRVFQLHVYPC